MKKNRNSSASQRFSYEFISLINQLVLKWELIIRKKKNLSYFFFEELPNKFYLYKEGRRWWHKYLLNIKRRALTYFE